MKRIDGGLSTGRVALRPFAPGDLDFLYYLSVDPTTAPRWRYRGASPHPEEFARSLYDGIYSHFIITRVESGEPVGYVNCYGADLRGSHAWLGVVTAPHAWHSGAGIEGLGLFINYLFATAGFRKLYGEVPEYNLDQFGSGRGTYFREEGRLTDHEWLDGRWWDRVYIAVWREEWETTGRPMVDKLMARRGGSSG